MTSRRSSTRSRTAGAAIAGVVSLLVAGILAASCGTSRSDGANDSGSPTKKTSTTVTETIAIPPTTAAPTTTLPPTTTTTTTKAWPKAPVVPVPAAGAVPVISRIATTDPVVFLTIDDGTIRDPRVPELLAQFKVPATLFVNEGPYLADPDYFLRVIAAGGSINSHTRSHRRLTSMSASAQRSEICGMRDIIDEHVFVPGHLFRAPYGISNASTQTAAGSCGINAVLFWHAALNDGRVQYQQGDQLQPGDIILTHFRDDLYDNIRALLWQCAIQGLTVAPVEDYLPLPGDG